VSRPTLVKWRREDKWVERRKEQSVTQPDFAIRIKKSIMDCLDDMDKARTESGFIAPEYIKRLDYLSRVLIRVDGNYDLKGNVLTTLQMLIEFATSQNDTEALGIFNRFFPRFLDWVDIKYK
jgi:hypothetical protein